MGSARTPPLAKTVYAGGDFERRHLIRAQRHRRRRLNVGVEAQLPRHVDHARRSRSSPRTLTVATFSESVRASRSGHHAVEILRRNCSACIPCRRNRTSSARPSTVVAGVTIGDTPSHRIVKRRGVNERLEHRARLAPRQNVIELALAVIAPADDGANLSRVRIEHDHGHLRLRPACPASSSARTGAPAADRRWRCRWKWPRVAARCSSGSSVV